MTNIQIQNQYDNYNNTPVDHIMIDDETEHVHLPEARAPTGRIEVNNDEEIMIQNQYRTILRWTTSTTTRSASTRKRSSSLKKMTRS